MKNIKGEIKMKDEKIYELIALNDFFDDIIKGKKYKLKRHDHASSGWASSAENDFYIGITYTWDKINLQDTFGDVEQRIEEQVETNIYHFRDTEINFEQVCYDMLEDNIPSFVIIGKGNAYIGSIKSIFSDWNVNSLPYDISEIRKEDINDAIRDLKDFAGLYRDHQKNLKGYIKDRQRDKENNRFKVMIFK